MVAKESNLRLVIAGLMLGILMVAMDNTIVATSIGTIVSDLGGLDKFICYFCLYGCSYGGYAYFREII